MLTYLPLGERALNCAIAVDRKNGCVSDPQKEYRVYCNRALFASVLTRIAAIVSEKKTLLIVAIPAELLLTTAAALGAILLETYHSIHDLARSVRPPSLSWSESSKLFQFHRNRAHCNQPQPTDSRRRDAVLRCSLQFTVESRRRA